MIALQRRLEIAVGRIDLVLLYAVETIPASECSRRGRVAIGLAAGGSGACVA